MELPITGPGWQVMRVSRNRYWGNPNLIAFIERLANHAKKIGWNGILIGDLSQPRGGPMFTGHTSHQIGLDVDIWFTPAPDQELSKEEREFNLAQNMVSEDRRDVDPKVWTSAHTEVVRAAAEDGAASRIFVNPAIQEGYVPRSGCAIEPQRCRKIIVVRLLDRGRTSPGRAHQPHRLFVCEAEIDENSGS